MQDENLHAALCAAVSEKRWEQLSVLLHQGADITGYDGTSIQTALFSAIRYNAPNDIVIQLISPHNINMQDKHAKGLGNTALHEAVRKKRWDLVSVLIQHGADINMHNKGRKVPLHGAVQRSAPPDVIAQLISPQNINVKDKAGQSALHEAVRNDVWQLVQSLQQHGADINMCNGKKETPLHLAVVHNAPMDIIDLIVSAHNVNMQDKGGDTTLNAALQSRRWELVAILQNHGADINLANEKKETPLHIAASQNAPLDIITRLISPHNVNMQTVRGHTALHRTVANKRHDLLPVLLDHGADVNLGDIWGAPPIYKAIALNAEDAVPQLVSAENINKPDKHRYTVLHMAAGWARWQMLPVLLQHGADVNPQNDSSQSPLHLAVSFDIPPDIIPLLISHHNINLRDNEGDTALDYAIRDQRWELVPILLQHGADPGMADADQQEPSTLMRVCILTIRRHMPVKSDEAYDGLGLPKGVIVKVKLGDVAQQLVLARGMKNL